MKSYLITSFWWHDPADSSRFLGSFTLGTSTHHSSNRRMESTEHQPHSFAWGSFYWNLAEGAGHSTKMEFDGIWELKSTWGSGYVTFGWFDMIWSTCVFFSISRVSQQCHVQPEVFFTWTVPRVESSHGTDPQTLPQQRIVRANTGRMNSTKAQRVLWFLTKTSIKTCDLPWPHLIREGRKLR